MKKQTIELVLPKCPAWFIKLNEEEFSEEILKVEDFFSPTQLEYFYADESFDEAFRGRGREKISKYKLMIENGLPNCDWAEQDSSIIFGHLYGDESWLVYLDKEGTKIEDEEMEIFNIRRKSMSKNIDAIKEKLEQWKLKQQERIHTKWIETFAKLVREP